MEEGIPTEELARRAGLSYRIVDYWVRQGVLRPSVAHGDGTGTKRRFSDRDVRLATLLNQLRAMGARIDTLRAVARNVIGDPLYEGVVHVSPLGDVSWAPETPPWPCWWAVDVRWAVIGQPSHPRALIAA